MFTFKAKYYSEIDEEMKTEQGFVVGDSFQDAMKILEEYYGNDMETVELDYCSDIPVIIVKDDDTFKTVKKENDW